MWQVIVGVGAAVLAVIATLWYTARKSATAESTAAAEKRAREDANRRTEYLEKARLAEEALARKKDVDEGSEIVRRGDSDAAGDYLVRTFPGSKRRSKP